LGFVPQANLLDSRFLAISETQQNGLKILLGFKPIQRPDPLLII
jgi:hypothetical protein